MVDVLWWVLGVGVVVLIFALLGFGGKGSQGFRSWE